MNKKISVVLAVVCCVVSLQLHFGQKCFADKTVESALSASAPAVNAKAYVLMDVNTGTVLLENNGNEALYPASVTKIMSLLLVCEAIDSGKLSFDETLVCSETASEKGGSQIWLEPGEEMTVRDLLKATAVYSANDACTLLGEAVAGSEEAFVHLMNERAAALGMERTHFDNCTGLDDDTTTHQTTAYDVALMSRALAGVRFIREYTTVWMDTLRNGKTQLVNTNKLIRYYPGATGLKTGTTSKAGCCVSATAERDGLELIAVVMGASNSSDRFNGARALLDYGFTNYEVFTPQADASLLTPVPVIHGECENVELYADGLRDVLLHKGEGAGVQQRVTIAESAEAPIIKGEPLGDLEFYNENGVVARYSLKAAADIEKLTFSKAFLRIFRSLGEIEKEKK